MENGVLLQGFHWYTAAGGVHWNWLKSKLKEFQSAGITAIWIPPPYKCDHPADNVGYAPYDLWDCGKFPQKGQIPTKYGTEEELFQCCALARQLNIQIYVDAVFNHKAGADATENVQAIVVAGDDRRKEIGSWINIDAWTRFDFPERMADPEGKKRSLKTWNADDFDAVDYAENLKNWGPAIFKIKGKKFQTEVSWEKGNYDYLCFSDIDMNSVSAKDDLKQWGTWFLNHFGANGFRFDAAKHIRSFFFKDYAESLKTVFPELFCVGEYWETSDLKRLTDFLDETGHLIHLFDVPLQTRFHQVSTANPRNSYDLRLLLSGTLSSTEPYLAVTFVENHDTVPYQKLEQPVDAWFKPWAYAFILLREQGYPTIFLPDYTGAQYQENGNPVELYSHQWVINRLMAVRHTCVFGAQVDYFDHPNTVGWIRMGDDQHKGVAVILSNGNEEGWKWMNTGKKNSPYIDIFQHRTETVFTDESGWGKFMVNPESCSVWIPKDSHKMIIDKLNNQA